MKRKQKLSVERTPDGRPCLGCSLCTALASWWLRGWVGNNGRGQGYDSDCVGADREEAGQLAAGDGARGLHLEVLARLGSRWVGRKDVCGHWCGGCGLVWCGGWEGAGSTPWHDDLGGDRTRRNVP